MSTANADNLEPVLRALADTTRRTLLRDILASPGLTTSELAARASSITRWGVMKHLDVLRAAGLVQTMTNGRQRRHYAERTALEPLRAWLSDL